jgi:hypothetical protein
MLSAMALEYEMLVSSGFEVVPNEHDPIKRLVSADLTDYGPDEAIGLDGEIVLDK